MIKGFWIKLKKPILALAPMADVTDAAFRRIIAKYGKPDVIWTEFVSADGLFLRPINQTINAKAKTKHEKILATNGVGIDNPLALDLLFHKSERPIVAQFFTSRPEMMYRAAKLASELGFDGVDINMGCPDRSIEKQGAGAALIKNPKLAREILRKAIDGASVGNRKLPVSVKTRIGYNKDELALWLPELLVENPAAIIIHARTRKEMSKVPAQFKYVNEAVKIRDALKSETLILGNGDILNIEEAKRKTAETGADGMMLGRAIFGNPFLFGNNKTVVEGDKLLALLNHVKLFEKLFGGAASASFCAEASAGKKATGETKKNFSIMKKHFKAYVKDKDLRSKLMETKNAEQVEKIVQNYLDL